MSRTVVLWLAMAGILVQPLVLGSSRIPAMASDGAPGYLAICEGHGVSHVEFDGGHGAPDERNGSAKTCGVSLICHTIAPVMPPVVMLLGVLPPTTSTNLIQSADPTRADPGQSAYSERAPPALV